MRPIARIRSTCSTSRMPRAAALPSSTAAPAATGECAVLITLFSLPAPGQCLKGDDRFLSTVRTRMHKAPLTALAAGLVDDLASDGISAEVRISDLQTRQPTRVWYGELDLGEGVVLDKYRVGAEFAEADDEIRNSGVVGINSNFTHSRRIVADFIAHARRVNGKALIVVGGTDATADSSFYLHAG